MKADVGFSTLEEEKKAGKEAIESATESIEEPDLTFLFTTEFYEQSKVYGSIKEEIGDSQLLGFCGGGIISPEGILEKGIGVGVLKGKNLQVETVLEEGLDDAPNDAGIRAGEKLKKKFDSGTVVLLPDGFVPNLSEVVRGVYDAMGPNFNYMGGGTGDNLKFFKTFQFTEEDIKSGAISAAVLSGPEIGTSLGHGWKPRKESLTITETEGKKILEIDGRPAFDIYSERLGDISLDEFEEYGMKHPLGIADMAGNYTIRDPIDVDEDKNIDLVTEMSEGSVAYIMESDMDDLIDKAGEVAREARKEVPEPKFALLFDCISRTLLMDDKFKKELKSIRESIGEDVPILGALTFGEIGSYSDVPLFHNKTVSCTVIGE
ncbi:MAG: FIST C-terminal domain-containing protein [Candidatus Thermoplasmatota archaeon]|nr:FIST C-terminal domain-containing protein [Candidatus Thermoplasmatota archaeon]